MNTHIRPALSCSSLLGAVLTLSSVAAALGEIKIVTARNDSEHASSAFKFQNVPAPSRSDAAAKAQCVLVEGSRDANGGDLAVLTDGRVPVEEDQPAENFFFRAGTDGGRLLFDLGAEIPVKQVNTYSWHPGTRGPQVYVLFASDGKAADFNPQPKKGTDPEQCGWKRIARVDTRPKEGEGGGQYGVSIADSTGVLGQYRYLLFDLARTETSDGFGNTFYSEIDIVDRDAPAVVEAAPAPAAQPAREIVEIAGGKYQITLDTTETPDLTEWAHTELAPVVREWYPKIVGMLPSEGYEAPARVTVLFSKNMQGVADTSGTRVRAAASWIRRELKREAKGSIVHELVHVVQNYGRARRTNPTATRNPGWMVEGLADYIRWFKYEPDSRGAEVSQRGLARAKFDASYRVSANFLDYVVGKYDKDLVSQLNAAMRQGKYTEDLWKTRTGHTVSALGDEWKAALEKKYAAAGSSATTAGASTTSPKPAAPAASASAPANTLTETEKAAGWKLLFNGQNLEGWHNFKREGVRPGWQVKDGTLACVDPHNAGDLVTAGQYGWYELQLDYNISEGGNSGIMYHVTDQGGAAWATGPEFQLEDNAKAADPVRCGWLYALYQPPDDPKTGKPLDATKPAGQWNHLRLLLSPEKCVHEINGVKYFEYVLGSPDFLERVAKSKFAGMPLFAKSNTGYLCLQGDHGQVAFRNIKLRPLQDKK